ncbi:MAG: hypothetical protein ACI9SP_002907 [Arenicella sp.]|jgi:hypothetical protein
MTPVIKAALLSIILCASVPVSASDADRFDFSKSLRSFESHRDRYFERIVFESSESEFKQYRKEQILGIQDKYFRLANRYGPIYVTVLFDVTQEVPIEFDVYQHRESIIGPHLKSLIDGLSEDERSRLQLKTFGEPVFAESRNTNRYYEKIDLFINRALVNDLIDHPKFVDIVFAGVSEGIAVKESPNHSVVRLSRPQYEGRYKSEFLIKGYYQEISEALTKKSEVNVHVELDQASDFDAVIGALKPHDYRIIRTDGSEFLVTLNSSSAQMLMRDRRVKLMKDYEFHHDLKLARGIWKPFPLSKARDASESEISRIPFDSRVNFFDQPTYVLESQAQLNQYLSLIGEEYRHRQESLLQALQYQKINFSKKNLVIYSQQETSGSIGLKPKKPVWVDDELVVIIDRSVPELGSANVVPHFFAYIIDKGIPKIVFRSAKKKSIVENSAQVKP